MKKQIPVTGLRRFYVEATNSSTTANDLAKAKMVDADRLAKCFCESVKAFEVYENISVGFISEKRSKAGDDITGHNCEEVVRTIELAAQLKYLPGIKCKVMSPNGLDLSFSYVDREFVPARTPYGEFEDPKFSTRRNRSADLLLKSKDARPIIAEVKIRGDRNPYFALMQVLMHASEMVTKNQIKRLLNQYSDKFNVDESRPRYDVYLILVGYEMHEMNGNGVKLWKPLLEETERICQGLVKSSSFSRYVRSVVCLNLREGRAVKDGFDVKFVVSGN